MGKKELTDFLLQARTQTYAGDSGTVDATLSGSKQLEFTDGDWFYRDIYYLGNGIFPGLETIYFNGKPIWSMSYFGDFKEMTEEQVDTMLRRALIDNQESTRIYNKVEKDYGEFRYACYGEGDIDEVSGTEEIYIGDKRVYFFYYAGGSIG
jgi:hypothetical protein